MAEIKKNIYENIGIAYEVHLSKINPEGTKSFCNEVLRLNGQAPKSTFKNAVINGIAPDKGLYFPESITPLDKKFFDQIESLSNEEIAFQAIHQFVGDEIPEVALRQIIKETLCFDFPLVGLDDNIVP